MDLLVTDTVPVGGGGPLSGPDTVSAGGGSTSRPECPQVRRSSTRGPQGSLKVRVDTGDVQVPDGPRILLANLSTHGSGPSPCPGGGPCGPSGPGGPGKT